MQTAKRFIIIAGVVVLLLIVVGLVLAFIFGVLQEVLYVALFILALLMVGATIFQIYSILMLVRTISTVRNEMKPLVASVQETVGIVKDTAKTASHTVSTLGSTVRVTSEFAIGPGVRAVSAVVAGREMVRVFLGRGRTRTRAEERRQKQMEAIQTMEGGNG